MNAVLEVDDKAGVLPLFLHHLIDPGRAIALRRLGIVRQIDQDGQIRIGQLQMWRLAFLMVCHGEAHIGQPIKRQFPIWLRIVNRCIIGRFPGRLRVSFAMFDRAKQAEFED